MADYPTATYSPRTKTNKTGVVYDENQSDVAFAEDIEFLDAEVVAIEDDLRNNIKPDLADAISDISDLSTSKQNSLGYTPENVSNKDTSGSLGTSDTKYPSQKAVKTYVDTGLGTKEDSLGYTPSRLNLAVSLSLSKTNSTTSDQDFSSVYTIPANKITTDKILKVTLLLKIVAGTSSANLIFYVKIGSTKMIITPSANHSDNVTNYSSFTFYILGTASPSSSSAVSAFIESARPSVQVTTQATPQNLATNGTLDIVPGVTYSATGSTETTHLLGALIEEF
jgi:hypothetical protein